MGSDDHRATHRPSGIGVTFRQVDTEMGRKDVANGSTTRNYLDFRSAADRSHVPIFIELLLFS
jgi:hypothetical protein